MSDAFIYKIITSLEWQAAKKQGVYKGSALDQADGYIHCSTAEQIPETLKNFFKDEVDLVLLCVDSARIEQHLKWEKSGSGKIYPHIYGPLPINAVIKQEKIT